jgi:hypothetical protein
MKQYPEKVLLAWGEAIRENKEISTWLSANGYQELVVFCLSLRGSRKADKWLFENGFPELVALVSYICGDEQAAKWLDSHKLTVLRKLGDAVYEEPGALEWLAANDYKSLVVVAQKLLKTSEEVDFAANDVHRSPFR